jgi:HTH-type transcriptional regulator/antitoxin HigA
MKPIRNRSDLDAAIERLNKVFGSPAHTPEGDECEILTALIEHYEARNYPDPFLDPVAVIKVRMEELALKRKDLVDAIGSETGVSLILSGKRPLTLRMIRNLSKLLKVPPGLLIGDDPMAATG